MGEKGLEECQDGRFCQLEIKRGRSVQKIGLARCY